MTPQAPPSPVSAQLACDRLVLSRERLRRAMYGMAHPERNAARQTPGQTANTWLHRLQSIPGAGIVLETVRSWWARHPLRVPAMVGAEAVAAVARPMAQRNPLGLVTAAFLFGVVLAWRRPWRWIIKPALFAGLMPQLVSKVFGPLPRLSWMSLLASLAQQPPSRSGPTQPPMR